MTTKQPHELFVPACRAFGGTLAAAGSDDWARPTPCTDWDVRALTNHLVSENVWVAPLLGGATIAEVGDQFDGDLLGADPYSAWSTSADAAIAAVEALADLDQPVHLSHGDEAARHYLDQLASDNVIHRWDLAVGLGQDPTLDPEMVDVVAIWFEDQMQSYLDAGVIDPPLDVPADADPQTSLLAMFGRVNR